MAFDITEIAKTNATTFILAGIGGVIWMLIFPKSTSIFGPKVGVPVGWGSAILMLGLGAYGLTLNSSKANAAAGVPNPHAFLKTHGHHYGTINNRFVHPSAQIPVHLPEDLDHFPHLVNNIDLSKYPHLVNNNIDPAHPHVTLDMAGYPKPPGLANNPYVTFQ